MLPMFSHHQGNSSTSHLRTRGTERPPAVDDSTCAIPVVALATITRRVDIEHNYGNQMSERLRPSGGNSQVFGFILITETSIGADIYQYLWYGWYRYR